MVLAAPVLAAVLLMVGLDRTAQTSFFLASSGGSPYLFENLFWFFGHPEVYVLALPGFGILLEILPVFARKPLWGYRLAVAGMLGVALLSFFVWQHHLFVSGINSALRPFYMLSTEVISIPTGFIFLCGMATLWRASIRYTVPMLFCLAWFFNFFIGGISGVFLSDTPSDVSTHGSFFVMAHFHYTIMGGLIFTFFAAIYYWVPKMTGLQLQRGPREDPLLVDVHRLQLHLRPALRGRPAGDAAARVDLRLRPPADQHLGLGVGVRARRLDARLHRQRPLLAWSSSASRRRRIRGDSKSLEWQLPTPVPVHDFDTIPVIDSDPYDYGTPPPPPRPAEAPADRARIAMVRLPRRASKRARRCGAARRSRRRSTSGTSGSGRA